MHWSSRLRGQFWRRAVVALTILTVAVPFVAATPSADAASSRLITRINSPKDGDTVSGFITINHTVTPVGYVGLPARREDNPYRGYFIQYAAGKNPADSDFQTYYMSSWTYKSGFNCSNTSVGAKGSNNLKTSLACDRSTYMPPGVGSVRVRRGNGTNFDTTVLPDGPATIRLRSLDINGATKDVTVTVNVENKGVEPAYADMMGPKNGETVSGWVPIAFNAMPQRQGIARGVKNSPWTTFLPSCLDIDINYWKIQYAQGVLPEDSELIDWAYSDYGYSIFKDTIPTNGNTKLGPAGCAGSPVFQVGTATNWNSTLVPDGPATIKVSIVYNDGGVKQFYRVVNVQNNGKGVQYFGLDKAALQAKPLSGDSVGIPGYADVPINGVPTWSYQLPTKGYGCDIAAGEVAANDASANWTMFWISDSGTWNNVFDAQGNTVGGQSRLPDYSPYRTFGRSGAACRLDTTALPNGRYTIRLFENLTDGTSLYDAASVDIKN